MVHAAAIYARISNDPKGDRLGVNRQVEDCEALAARLGWTVRDRYVDDDRSAYSGKPRPEYNRLISDITSRTIDGVLAYNLDRLHRQPREFEAFLDTCDAAHLTNVHTVQNDFNLATSQGRAMARVMGTFARLSSDATSERVTRKNLERATAGLPTGGGPRPFGFMLDRIRHDPGEATLVREAASRVLAGEALRTIAAEWNERGITTTTGKPWIIPTLKRTLTNPRMSGQRVYRGEVIGPANWEPILTPQQTAALVSVIAERSRARFRPIRRYLLSGLLHCGLCGEKLIARPQADGTRRYVCTKGLGQTGCGKLAINAESVEDFIARAILLRLDTPGLAKLLAGEAEAEALSTAEQANLSADRDQLDELATAYGQRRIGFSEWLAARKPIEDRIEATRKKIGRLSRTAAVEPYAGKPDALRAAWPTLTLNQQRSIVAALLDRAIVSPARRGRSTFDPDRIEPVWRDA